MRSIVCLLGIIGYCLLTSSCFLISVPVKATGEIIEKSAHASGRAISRSMDAASTPDGVENVDAYGADDQPASGASYDEYGYPE